MSNYIEIQRKVQVFIPQVIKSLKEVLELDNASRSVLSKCLNNAEYMKTTGAYIKIQAILDYMHEQINIGNWKDVRLFLRKTITIASYLKVLAILSNETVRNTNDLIKQLFEAIDYGLMFGCSINEEPQLLQKCASLINTPHATESTPVISNNLHRSSKLEDLKPTNAIDIAIESCPSMERFYTNYIMQEKPVILEKCIDHWPAMTKWQDNNYFIKLAGLRTVSIEIGKQYTDSNWTQKLITVKDFIDTYIYQSNGPTGYLAQYPLFNQIPELYNDIVVPEYCSFSDSDDNVDIMAWYGPKGTVSPMHHDPTKNLLAQVVGEKRIYLFSPKESEYLYPYDSDLLDNTARVDPRNPDFENYPKYKEAKPYYCVLQPGQVLYIPPKWWHFVESLSISFSVSFWWK